MASSLRDYTPDVASASKKFVDDTVAGSGTKPPAVVLFSKNTCPRCIEAEALLSELLQTLMPSKPSCDEMVVLELSQVPPPTTPDSVQDELWDRTGCRTVPRIFVGGMCLGGFDDILEKHQAGALLPALSQAMGRSQPVAAVPSSLHGHSIQENPSDFAALTLVNEKVGAEQKRGATLVVPTSMTGLMLKSAAMAELGLQGCFSDYVLVVEDSCLPDDNEAASAAKHHHTFPSRKPIAATLAEAGAAEEGKVLIRKRLESEAKPVGRT
jgi:glutaredoxin 3